MKPEYFLIAAVVLIAIIAIPVALYAWMTSPTKVLDEIDALDLDAATKAILKSCCESAKAADNKVRFYDLTLHEWQHKQHHNGRRLWLARPGNGRVV